MAQDHDPIRAGSTVGAGAPRPAPTATAPSAATPRPPSDPLANRLLAALPPEDWARVQTQLERCGMPQGQVLYEAGSVPTYAYFPTSSIASLMYVTENGDSTGIAVVGNGGVVGIPLFMGGGSTPGRAVVHLGGEGFRMPAFEIRSEFARAGSMMKLLLRYTQALIAQMAQTAVCNRHHSLEQQLSRWLLMNLDRLPGNELAVTQERISHLLGVRREGVTEAARKLQALGLIRYARGHIQVLDQAGLAARSCECHAVVQREYARLLPDPPLP